MFSCNGSVTTPPTLPPVASSDLGIFANDPIPAPCPANTKLMNEVLGGGNNGSWIRRPAFEGSNTQINHVYRFVTNTPDPSNTLGRVEWGDYQSPGFINAKISPYPCDFATKSELESAHGSDPVHWNTAWGAKCGGEGIS